MKAATVAAERVIAAAPPDVFAFLADLENHWLLADRFVDVLSLQRAARGGRAEGGEVRLHGPLRVGRTVRTRLVETRPVTDITGTASLGPGTEAEVHWSLAPVPDGTRVRLEATVNRISRFDALLLAAGGRRWLEARFAAILATLDRRLATDSPQRSSA